MLVEDVFEQVCKEVAAAATKQANLTPLYVDAEGFFHEDKNCQKDVKAALYVFQDDAPYTVNVHKCATNLVQISANYFIAKQRFLTQKECLNNNLYDFMRNDFSYENYWRYVARMHVSTESIKQWQSSLVSAISTMHFTDEFGVKPADHVECLAVLSSRLEEHTAQMLHASPGVRLVNKYVRSSGERGTYVLATSIANFAVFVTTFLIDLEDVFLGPVVLSDNVVEAMHVLKEDGMSYKDALDTALCLDL